MRKDSSKGPIYCIGDSHVNLFSGYDHLQKKWPHPSRDRLPQFKVYRVGAGLAYNLRELGTTMGTRERLLKAIETIPPESQILLCFGEIDCRFHLIRHAEKTSKNWDDVAEECAARYFEGLQVLIEKRFKVSVYNVIPSARQSKIDKKFPTTGTCLERNKMTQLFNAALREKCSQKGLPFVESFESLINQKGLTKSLYYLDKVHLAQRALPHIMRAIENALPDFKFEKPKYHSIRICGSWLHLIFRIRRLFQILRPNVD